MELECTHGKSMECTHGKSMELECTHGKPVLRHQQIVNVISLLPPQA